MSGEPVNRILLKKIKKISIGGVVLTIILNLLIFSAVLSHLIFDDVILHAFCRFHTSIKPFEYANNSNVPSLLIFVEIRSQGCILNVFILMYPFIFHNLILVPLEVPRNFSYQIWISNKNSNQQ